MNRSFNKTLLTLLVSSLALAMCIGLVHGFISGDFFEEGGILVGLAWGKVAILDVYIGFLLFGIWIFYRERNILRFMLWFVPLLLIGNLVSAVYLLSATLQSKGDLNQLLFGQNIKR